MSSFSVEPWVREKRFLYKSLPALDIFRALPVYRDMATAYSVTGACLALFEKTVLRVTSRQPHWLHEVRKDSNGPGRFSDLPKFLLLNKR
jgi:hypothetical protein